MALTRWLTVGAMLAMAATLVGCATSGPSATQTPSSVASPTASQAAEPTPSPSGTGVAHTCSAAPGASRFGDLAVSAPSALYGFNLDYMLPDGISTDKPLVVTMQDGRGYALGKAIESRPVVQAAFVISVCNTSSASAHRLTNFGVMLDSLTSYGGHLNVINGCAFLYSRPTGFGGECASGYSPDLDLSFRLPGTATPHATATQTPGNPIELAPGYGLDISFDMTPPSSPAIATYRFGLGVDGAAITYPSALGTLPIITAPIARRWAGDYCSAPQMQAQIPATIPANTYYACPQV